MSLDNQIAEQSSNCSVGKSFAADLLLLSREFNCRNRSSRLFFFPLLMATCFVIQPFDGGNFDNRCEDVFAPAIKESGFDPYRVDRDPSASIPIDEIQRGIKQAAVCLADITLDNPNVWFELGYALSAGKSVVMVCGITSQIIKAASSAMIVKVIPATTYEGFRSRFIGLLPAKQ